MGKFGIGQGLSRVEDSRLLRGEGCYSDDIRLAGEVHGIVVRSPYAHARIVENDLTAARAAPGVLGVFSAADLDADGIGDIPCLAPMTGKNGSATVQPGHPVLARERVRHVGDPVAFVVADTLDAARDAAELVMPDYEELPAVVDTGAARDPRAPQIWDAAPGNLCLDWEQGDKVACAAAFAEAAKVVSLELVNNRVVVNALEPRVALGVYDPDDNAGQGRYTLYSGNQGAHRVRNWLAEHNFHEPPERFHVICPDVGGSFGMKIFIYAELVLVLWAARRVGRPVRWCADRSESFLCDAQSRDHVSRAELALDGEGRILALRAATTAAMGAYLSNFAPFIPTGCSAPMFSGLYRIPQVYVEVACVFTNTVPVDAYRGAGRPEAAYLVERLIDHAAREIGETPAAFRRRNFITPDTLPYRTATGVTYDSGDFPAMMVRAMQAVDWQGFDRRREKARAAGRYRGLGMACYVEACGSSGEEGARMVMASDGHLILDIGTQTNGQGHATAYGQILADRLGLEPDAITVRQGDSDRLSVTGGTGGSRSIHMGGMAIGGACDVFIERARRLAGDMLEAAEADIEFSDSTFIIVGTDRQVTLTEVAGEAEKRGDPLQGEGEHRDATGTYPNGCHLCELEVDPETGRIEVLRYLVVDDFGTLINPLLVAGQVHGGTAQGLGQALLEDTRYDGDSGQLLSGSLMDYCLPRADDLPSIELTLVEDYPCTTNEMGVKGAGEAGAIGACPAIINALVDALSPLGVRHIDMPATPERVWRAIRNAGVGS